MNIHTTSARNPMVCMDVSNKDENDIEHQSIDRRHDDETPTRQSAASKRHSLSGMSAISAVLDLYHLLTDDPVRQEELNAELDKKIREIDPAQKQTVNTVTPEAKALLLKYFYKTEFSVFDKSECDDDWLCLLRFAVFRKDPLKVLLLQLLQMLICIMSVLFTGPVANIGTSGTATFYVLAKVVIGWYQSKHFLRLSVGSVMATFKSLNPDNWSYKTINIIIMVAMSAFCMPLILGNCKAYLGIAHLVHVTTSYVIAISAIGAGMRSQTATRAITVFVGFDFVAKFDASLIARYSSDYPLVELNPFPRDNRKVYVLLFLFCMIFALVATLAVLYTAFTGLCFFLCDNPSITAL